MTDEHSNDTPPTSPTSAGTAPESPGEEQVVVIGPDGQPIGMVPLSSLQQGQLRQAAEAAEGSGNSDPDDDDERSITSLVEQPAKVMRIGGMIRQLLEEVKAAPLDEASRARLKEIHRASVKELETGLAPELVDELERLSLPFTDEGTPSESELRIAQAQLVGWLEGLFHGIQTAIYAQQMASRAQLEQIRRALPMAGGPVDQGGQSAMGGQPGTPGSPTPGGSPSDGGSGGMYL